jgi:hypothetical protein
LPLTIIVPKHHPPRPNEPAWLLRETNELNKAKRSLRRVQRVWVNRNDQLAVFTKDLGPSSDFTYPELQIPAEWCHTVAELQAIAEEVRNGRELEDLFEERQQSSTLVQDWLDQVERNRQVMRNRSVFGVGGKTQRNGFSTAALDREVAAAVAIRRARNANVRA